MDKDLCGTGIGPGGINLCETPGMRIRSKGKGRGLAKGLGKGPIGVPYFDKGVSKVKESRISTPAERNKLAKKIKSTASKFGTDASDKFAQSAEKRLSAWCKKSK